MTKQTNKEFRMSLRLTEQMVGAMDSLRESEDVILSRNTWIEIAISEKIERDNGKKK